MGVKIDNYPNVKNYQDHIHQIGDAWQQRTFTPLLHYNMLYWILGLSGKMLKVVEPVHQFSKKIIEERRLFSQSFEKIDDDMSVEMKCTYIASKN